MTTNIDDIYKKNPERVFCCRNKHPVNKINPIGSFLLSGFQKTKRQTSGQTFTETWRAFNGNSCSTAVCYFDGVGGY